MDFSKADSHDKIPIPIQRNKQAHTFRTNTLEMYKMLNFSDLTEK